MNETQEIIEWLEFQIRLQTQCMAETDFCDDLYKRFYSNREVFLEVLDQIYRIKAKSTKEVK